MPMVSLGVDSLTLRSRLENERGYPLAEQKWPADMNPIYPSSSDTIDRSLASKGLKTVIMSKQSGNGTITKSTVDYSAHWKVLLGEFIHLLALFWVHSRMAGTARASEVLFHQLLQHLNILRKMPNHTGDILVRRVQRQLQESNSSPDYVVIFGNILINSQEEIKPDASRHFSHLKSALGRACECFAEEDIHSLLLRLPGPSTESIDHFRFSLHILTRYFMAARDGTSIAFRYYGRSLVLPVVTDLGGIPDPNLTLMAALNGLSTVNARELIRQAQAYGKLDLSESIEGGVARVQSSCYDQIFRVRSLRSQIVKPPVEINNLQSPQGRSVAACILNAGIAAIADKRAGMREPAHERNQGDEPSQDSHAAIRRQDLAELLGSSAPALANALDGLFASDYAELEPMALGNRLASLSRLITAVDKRCQDPMVMAGIMDILQARLKGIADDVLANIITQRQGLKIVSRGRAVLVGLVHPRLFDLITLVKEHVVARQRMVIVKEIAFQVDPCHINLLADGFGIPVSDAHQIFRLLQGCFGVNGSFIRPTFESRVDAMSRHENVIFEILWGFLRQTPQRNHRLNFLNAVQLLMDRLNDPKRALQFLMADICLNPAMVYYTDRNAFALANILLHEENKELYVDVHRTPEDVLKVLRPLNQRVRHYAIWRLEVDQGRFLGKMRTIANNIQQVVVAVPGTGPWPFELAFLLALEREAIIFSALVQGYTARLVIREAFDRYGDPSAPIYQNELARRYLPQLIPHLQIVVRALGRAGNADDIERLANLKRMTERFIALDVHPAHGLRVKQMMKWVPQALQAIQAGSSRLERTGNRDQDVE
jgi:hypothetical protein